jgi:serine/threonine protein kinase/tetratricopeptide (TPR) repeat protein
MGAARVDVKSIFGQAMALRSSEERAAYLQDACGGDAALRAEVEALLQAHREAGSFLGERKPSPAATTPESIPEGLGTVIGPYTLREQLGEGGMGLVFVAEQQHPVRRKVALKVIKPGMDTRQVVARFEAERQALALMEHPHIARVLDGGETAAGRPYFVMELVKGVPITQFCDENRLTPRERLELFMSVCQAVQHAHQKGIIHRDLKPSNVLVTSHDGTPVAKVIDFGVAKAIGQQLTDKTVYTQLAQLVGTPLYMAPEQAGQSGLDVDTRSDIYALGVLLYELLTGTTPFDQERLRQVDFDELRRIIREEEPPRPSTRISTLGQAAITVCAQRRSDPRRLSQLCRGELDWVVMKCLEKDRNRRYETANALALDLQRYLADEPVQACPPSATYRFGKFARRHKGALAAAALVVVTLLTTVGAVAGSVGWAARDREARQAVVEGQAETALSDVQDAYAHDRLPQADQALKRAEGIVAGGCREELRRRLARWRQDLDTAARLDGIRSERTAGTGKDNKNFDVMAADRDYQDTFRSYSLDPEGPDPDETARGIRDSAIKDILVAALDDWVLYRRENSLPGWEGLLAVARQADSDPLRDLLRDAYQRGDRTALEDLAHAKEVAALPPATVLLLGSSLEQVGNNNLALAVLRKSLVRHPGDFWLHAYAAKCAPTTKVTPQECDWRAALAARPQDATAHVGLAGALVGQRRSAEAEAEFREATRLKPDWGTAYWILGNVCQHRQGWSDAEVAYRDAINHGYDASGDLRMMLQLQGKWTEAEDLYRAEIGRHPETPASHLALANCFWEQKKWANAEEEYREALRLDTNAINNSAHGLRWPVRMDLAMVLWRQEKLPQAESVLREALRLAPEDRSMMNLLRLVLEHESLAALEAQYRDGDRIKPGFVQARLQLGSFLLNNTNFDLTEAKFRELVRLVPENTEAHRLLGRCLKGAEAEKEYREAVRLAPDSATVQKTLGGFYARSGRWEQALAPFDRARGLTLGDLFSWCTAAALRLRTGDVEGYRRTCREILERFGDGKDSGTAAAVAEVCLLAPDPVDDRERVAKLASQAPAAVRDVKDSLHTPLGRGLLIRALAEYRAGRYGGAVEWLQRLYPQPQGGCDDATAFAVLALARQRLDAADAARVALRSAEAIAAQQAPDPGLGKEFGFGNTPGGYDAWLRCEILIREAQTVVISEDAEQAAARNADNEKEIEAAQERDRRAALEKGARDLAAAFARLGNVLRQQGKLAEAEARHQEAVRLDKENASYRDTLGRTLKRRGKWQEAVAAFEEATRFQPDHLDGYLDLARLLVACPEPSIRDPQRALAAAQKAVKLAQQADAWHQTDAWQVLGWSRYRVGDWKGSIEALEKSMALQEDPKGGDSGQWFCLALAHSQLGNQAEARHWYDQAATWSEKRGQDEDTYRFQAEAAEVLGIPGLTRGGAYAERGEWDKAAADYARVFEQQPPGDPFAWFEHAYLRLQVGDAEGYRKLCGRMRERFGGSTNGAGIPLFAHTCVLAPDALGDAASVLRLAEQRLAVTGPDPWSLHVLGLAQYRAGQHDKAIESLRKALKDYPDWDFHILNRLVLAMAHYQAGHAVEARQWFDLARKGIAEESQKNPDQSPRFAPPGWLWRDWLGVQMLSREPEELLNKQPENGKQAADDKSNVKP